MILEGRYFIIYSNDYFVLLDQTFDVRGAFLRNADIIYKVGDVMDPVVGTILVLLAVAALVAVCVRNIIKDHKGGSCGSCANASSCGGSCGHCNFDPNTPITFKRPKKTEE